MKANEAFEFTLTAADDDTKTAIQNEKVKIAANGDKAIVAGAKTELQRHSSLVM